jgi:hypothetical protein
MRDAALFLLPADPHKAAETNWGDQKILHHFEPGRKNLTVVSSIGSEALALDKDGDRSYAKR